MKKLIILIILTSFLFGFDFFGITSHESELTWSMAPPFKIVVIYDDCNEVTPCLKKSACFVNIYDAMDFINYELNTNTNPVHGIYLLGEKID